tara:strand:- start:402 stop:608 length:207 start_codon:yes stop_codon:yes gene_type:complete
MIYYTEITLKEFNKRFAVIKQLPEMDNQTFVFSKVVNPDIDGSCFVIIAYNKMLNTWVLQEYKMNDEV